ncbi:MAG: hypothetical protein J6L24_05335, partial [Oscillospiraceae bacterium]|nr:hypothetical protein [Oscillospiraceae bacterium]
PVEKILQAGLWFVYAILPEPTGFGYFLLKFSFYFSIDITPLDCLGNLLYYRRNPKENKEEILLFL